MTAESIFTHDEDGALHLRRTGNLEQRIEHLERTQDHTTAYVTTHDEQVRGLIAALTERLETLEGRYSRQRESLALAGIREDRG